MVNMSQEPAPADNTQADFIKKELNFDYVDPSDPLTKATLEEHPKDEWVDILGTGNLKKKIITEGKDGTRPQRTELGIISYIATLEDGTVVEEVEDMVVQVGDIEVIQGLDLALALMNVGEVSLLQISPRFAYGSSGKAPKIPPNATLQYKVTLKEVKQEEDIETMTFEKRKEIGNKKRERGNEWFKHNDPFIAIACYRRALEYLAAPEESETTKTWSTADFQSLLEDRMIVYNNLAMAQIKGEVYDGALESVENVLRCQPNNAKALFRKGKILHIKGEHTAAYNILLQALKVNPQDKKILQELEILRKKSEKDAQSEKKLYRKMLGTNKPKANIPVNKDKTSKKSSKIAWSVIGGTAIAVIGLFAYRLIS